MENLQKSINELMEMQKQYNEDVKIYYENMEKQMEEIKLLSHYTLSEQELLKIESMTIKELLVEMQNNVEDIRKMIAKFDDNKKVKDSKVVEWESYAGLVGKGGAR